VHFVNVSGSILVAPFGGVDRRFSTAPFTVGFPVPGGDPIILDFATSLVAEGKVLVASRGGKPLPDDETRAIAAGLAAGLAHAHARGLVHRDLKPSNVLFDAEGRPKIADFGIARMGDAGTLTEAGTVMGTAAYISPEQAAGEPATPASDVYSLGVILFRMLTGRLPFTAQQPLELAAMHRDLPAPAVESFRNDVPPALAGVVNSPLA
jgi:serine/threonine-protein kinase